jgi:hypothetical protein
MYTIELVFVDDPVLIAVLAFMIAFGAWRIIRRLTF